MGKHIQEASHEDAMNMWNMHVSARPKPPDHTVWSHDFMALGLHNIACPVCFDAPAVLTRNVTVGQWDQKAQPCVECQKKGWKIRQVWWRDLLRLGAKSL